MSQPLLDIQNLSVTFTMPNRTVQAVRNLSFTLGQEKIGIVGESGSGKSQTGRAILGLTAKNGRVDADRISYKGRDLRTLSHKEWYDVRGGDISMIMQDPKYSLNPVMSIGQQIMEAYRDHHKISRKQARLKALEMLEKVKIRNPELVFKQYPHEVSGGMGQRVMIAMMLIPKPSLIIADEITSALDVTVQLQILAILDDLVKEENLGLIFISHDLDLVSTFCDRVLVMYQGEIVEELTADQMHNPQHPYTQGLARCIPRFNNRGQALPTLDRSRLTPSAASI